MTARVYNYSPRTANLITVKPKHCNRGEPRLQSLQCREGPKVAIPDTAINPARVAAAVIGGGISALALIRVQYRTYLQYSPCFMSVAGSWLPQGLKLGLSIPTWSAFPMQKVSPAWKRHRLRVGGGLQYPMQARWHCSFPGSQ